MLSAALLAACLGTAHAADAPQQRFTDFTAYTVSQRQKRVGFNSLTYGLLENVSVGTSPLLLIVGPNIRAKVTAVELERLAFSLEGGYYAPYDFWLSSLTDGASNIDLQVTPIAWRGSWQISPKWSAHYGNTWTLGRVEGELTGGQIVSLIEGVVGAEIDQAIVDSLGVDTLYAGAQGNFTLAASNLAVVWQRKENAGFIFQSNNYLWASGIVAATAGTSDGESSAGVGVAAVFEQVLTTAPSAVSLSWQRSWDRLNLRLGIPLTAGNPFAFTQAFQLYWLLGPKAD